MAVVFKSYASQVLSAEQKAKDKALEIIGGKAESYAKKNCPVGTPESTGIKGYVGGRLKNSITHAQRDENTEAIGTNVEYAPYVELGHHTVSGSYVAGRPFLRKSVENHANEYKQIIISVLSDAMQNP